MSKRIIVTHQNSDLDAIASLVGAHLLYGDESICLRPGHLSNHVKRYLALHKDQLELGRPEDVPPEEVSEVVVVDVRKASRLRDFKDHLARADRVTVWDHHPASDDDIPADELHIEPTGACATLLCEAFKEEGVHPGESAATLMLMGIYADTGRLSFDSTTPRDVEAAAWLLRCGARLPVVNRFLQDQFSVDQQKLLAEMMFSTEEVEVNGADIVLATGRAEDYVKGVAGVVEHILNMGGHEAVFGLVEFSGGRRVEIIGRSQVPYIKVGSLLGELGGGGHDGAGGASAKQTSLEEVVERFKQLLQEATIDPTNVRDLMTSPIETLDRDMTLEEAARELERWDVTGAPVVDGDALDGVLSRRDIEGARESARLDLPVSSHMSHEVVTIGAGESLEDALELMTEHDIGRLPVLEEGRLVGIITRTDVLDHLYEES
jgi:tRNA nucleotidyltransferase (CCA-adding enzyme)